MRATRHITKFINFAAHDVTISRSSGKNPTTPQRPRECVAPASKKQEPQSLGLGTLNAMPHNVYYFDPSAIGTGLHNLGDNYRIIPIPRVGCKPPVWELPAVLVVDAGEGDLLCLEKSAPKSDAWGIICLLDGRGAPARQTEITHLRPASARCISRGSGKTVEKGF